MSAAAAASTSAVIAVMEEHFKKYIIVCEYLRLDPCLVYDIEFIQNRCDIFMENAEFSSQKQQEKTCKKLKWFVKSYKMLTDKSWRSYNFTKRCQKLIAKDKLKVFGGTILDELTVFEHSQNNYDFYAKIQNRQVAIAISITIGIFAIVAIILTAVLL